ncbi:MAG: ferredoxin [Halioglobus sp.]|nr:ferredoxin [Halioglobus sp.]
MAGRFCIKADMQLCQGHGECAEEAPELFEVAYDTEVYPKVKILQARPDPALRERAEAAARYCPNRVLTIEDID